MIVQFEQLAEVRARHRTEKIVLTGGCFDIIHIGHVAGLAYRKSQGDILVVGVSSDERVRQRKGEGRPIVPQIGRLAVVDALKSVDYSFIMPMPGEYTPTIQAVKALRPDIFIDHINMAERWEESRDYLASLGTTLSFDPTPRMDSTTHIIYEVVARSKELAQQ